MKRIAYLIIISSVLMVCRLNAVSANTLNIATCNWQPWQIVEDGRLKGITIDILQELAMRTGYTMKIRPLPQKRMMFEFETGKIDMEPAVSPFWRELHKDISVYTTPYYTTGDVILVRKESGIKGSSVQAFRGLTLGCGLGYYYPEGFQEAFVKGDIRREDNPVSDKNLLKLAYKRIDGIIVDKIQARYILKKNSLHPDDFAIAYEFKPSELSLRLHRNRQDLLPILNNALERMKADGIINRIVASYLE